MSQRSGFALAALAAAVSLSAVPGRAQSPGPTPLPPPATQTPIPAGAARALPSASSQMPAPPEPTPTSIGDYWYDAAYDHWRGLPRERFAVYETDLLYILKGKHKERKDRVYFRYHDGRCLIVGIPLDSRDRPDKTQITDRCFGPDFSFAFVQQRLGGFKNAPIEIPTIEPTQTPTPRASGSPEQIGKVKTRTRPYGVTFVGNEMKDGKETVHLSLVALYHPADHLLTDMWVDPQTLGVVHLRAVAEANDRLARITFEAFYDEGADSQVLRRVIGYAKAQVLLAKIGLDFTYSQNNFDYPDALPDWYFDQQKYDAHQAEVKATASGRPSPVPTPTS